LENNKHFIPSTGLIFLGFLVILMLAFIGAQHKYKVNDEEVIKTTQEKVDSVEEEVDHFKNVLGDYYFKNKNVAVQNDRIKFRYSDDLELEFVWVPATTSDKWKSISAGRDYYVYGDNLNDHSPLRFVRLTYGYYVSTAEITQEQWVRLMNENPSQHQRKPWQDEGAPVTFVSWSDIEQFINTYRHKGGFYPYNQVNNAVLLNDYEIRLPTEAEWEYAARSGMYELEERYLEQTAWVGNSAKTPQHTARKRPNLWGLYDMLGNVYEVTTDCWPNVDNIRNADERIIYTDPVGSDKRINTRGGAYFSKSQVESFSWRQGGCDSFNRRSDVNGFRLVIAPSLSSLNPAPEQQKRSESVLISNEEKLLPVTDAKCNLDFDVKSLKVNEEYNDKINMEFCYRYNDKVGKYGKPFSIIPYTLSKGSGKWAGGHERMQLGETCMPVQLGSSSSLIFGYISDELSLRADHNCEIMFAYEKFWTLQPDNFESQLKKAKQNYDHEVIAKQKRQEELQEKMRRAEIEGWHYRGEQKAINADNFVTNFIAEDHKLKPKHQEKSNKRRVDVENLDCNAFIEADNNGKLQAFGLILDKYFTQSNSNVGLQFNTFRPNGKLSYKTFVEKCGEPYFSGYLEYNNLGDMTLYKIFNSSHRFMYARVNVKNDNVVSIEAPYQFEQDVNELNEKTKQRNAELAKRKEYLPIDDIDEFKTLSGISLGDDPKTVINKASQKNIRYVPRGGFGEGKTGTIEVYDNLDDTSAALTNDIQHFNSKIFIIENQIRKGTYLNYLKNKLEEKYTAEPTVNNSSELIYILPNKKSVSLFIRKDTSGIVKLTELSAYEDYVKFNEEKKAAEIAEYKAYLKREPYLPIKDINKIMGFAGVSFRTDLNEVEKEATEKGIKTLKSVDIEKDMHGILRILDNLENTQAAKNINVRYFDMWAYQIRPKNVNPKFINYLKTELLKVAVPQKGHRDPFTGYVNNYYDTYRLNDDITVSIYDGGIILEDQKQIRKLKAFQDKMKANTQTKVN
jgi:formylglycine-generating enzyme required for sulfatase activity